MPITLNLPSIPPSGAQASAVAETKADVPPATAGFAQALRVASEKPRGEVSRNADQHDANDAASTATETKTSLDAQALAALVPIPLLIDIDRIGARLLAGDGGSAAARSSTGAALHPLGDALITDDAAVAGAVARRLQVTTRAEVADQPLLPIDAEAQKASVTATVSSDAAEAAGAAGSALRRELPQENVARLAVRLAPAVDGIESAARGTAASSTDAPPVAQPDTTDVRSSVRDVRGDDLARAIAARQAATTRVAVETPDRSVQAQERLSNANDSIDVRATSAAARAAVQGVSAKPELVREDPITERKASAVTGDTRTQQQEVAVTTASARLAEVVEVSRASSATRDVDPALKPVASGDPTVTIAPASPGPRESIDVTAPVASSQWSNEIATALSRVVAARQDPVDVRINQPQAAPIDLQVRATADRATLVVTAPDDAAQEALARALPELAEALARRGLALATTAGRPEAGTGNASNVGSPRTTSSATGFVNAALTAAASQWVPTDSAPATANRSEAVANAYVARQPGVTAQALDGAERANTSSPAATAATNSTLARAAKVPGATSEIAANVARVPGDEPVPNRNEFRNAADVRASRQEVAIPAPNATTATDALAAASKARDSSASVKPAAATNDSTIMALAPPAGNNAQPPEIVHIAAPVASAQWTNEIANKLTQAIAMRQDHVELRLNPPNLGPVDVQVRMSADQATVLIAAPHAITRDALEQALPQLRDALAQQGITLGQASVHSEAQRDASNPGAPRTSQPDSPVALGVADVPTRGLRSDRLVDTFA